MAQFDPAQRKVTNVFRPVHDGSGYISAGFNFVEYDGDPARYIEPVTDATFSMELGDGFTLVQQKWVNFELVNEREYLGLHQFA